MEENSHPEHTLIRMFLLDLGRPAAEGGKNNLCAVSINRASLKIEHL
jgi:hypothetical protein